MPRHTDTYAPVKNLFLHKIQQHKMIGLSKEKPLEI
jgi:hypothetical protein